MEVLHISDLHVSAQGETLSGLWAGPRAEIERRGEDHRFDFIIVSGDLSDGATPQQYQELSQFSQQELMPLLKNDRDTTRIIFVPGNHDVDWQHEFSDPDADPAPDVVEQLRRWPADPERRLEVSKTPRIHTIRSSKAYAERFANCQEALNNFYGAALRGSSRPFDLTAPAEEGQDWSAHVFDEEQVAIFGFNSCHANDKFYRGAQFNPKALDNAGSWIRERELQDYVLIAVWHHGLAADKGNPDHITFADLSRLASHGFRLGFHGHTHLADPRNLNLVGSQFVVVSTGSLGADPRHRPETISNQFSLVQVFPTRVRVEVMHRARDAVQYTSSGRQSFALGLDDPARDDEDAPYCSVHRRTWNVDAQGIATVEVALEKLRAAGPVPLAIVRRPYCQVEGTKPIIRGQLAGLLEQGPFDDGAKRYMADAAGAGGAAPDSLQWSYRVSNGLALTQSECGRMSEKLSARTDGIEGTSPTQDVVGHIVEFDCDRLELSLTLEATFSGEQDVPTIEAPEVHVERPVTSGGRVVWRPVPYENERLKGGVELSEDGRTARLMVPAPYVGRRYALRYTPKDPGVELSSDARQLLRLLLKRLRNELSKSELAARLQDDMLPVLARHLAHDDEEQPQVAPHGLGAAVEDDEAFTLLEWIGFLWDHDVGRLLPAFGRFRPRLWGHEYEPGSGVAGHAVRFARTVGWYLESSDGDSGLIYEERDSEEAARERWILTVPLLTPDGPALGCVAFGGREPNSTLAHRLNRIARHLSEGNPEAEQNRAVVESVVNTVFWGYLAEDPEWKDTCGPLIQQALRKFRGEE